MYLCGFYMSVSVPVMPVTIAAVGAGLAFNCVVNV